MAVVRIKELQKLVGASQDGNIGFESLSKFAYFFKKTDVQTIHFFANIDHESGGFTIIRENMNYRAPRIMQIFGVGRHSAKITQSESLKLAGNPYALAERVYGLGNPSKAKELGNLKIGDGFKFRGGGAIQITGGDAFKRFGDQNLYDNPDLIGDTSYYFTTAINYFDQRKVWDLAVDLSEAAIRNVCKRINGGFNGLDDRRQKISKYAEIFRKGRANSSTSIYKKATTNVNMRLEPKMGNNILQTLRTGDIVEFVSEEKGWTNVRVNGKTGYIATKYLK